MFYVGKNYKYNVEFYKELLGRENPNKEFIKRLIKSKGLSYRKLAELMQVDKKTICRLIKWNVYKSKASNQRLLSFILKTDRKELFPDVVKENEKDKFKSFYLYADFDHISNYEEVLNEKYIDYKF